MVKFIDTIKEILFKNFGEITEQILEKSNLIQYIIFKTRSAEKSSKARPCFGSLYALFVLIEDYIANGFIDNPNYNDYKGANYTELMNRVHKLPFGEKIQNHYLNNRVNGEFLKYFDLQVILVEPGLGKYWINEKLLKITIKDQRINLAKTIIEIIKEYINKKQKNFNEFMTQCETIAQLHDADNDLAIKFIKSLLDPTADARIFEIVSFSIMKYYYDKQVVYFGETRETAEPHKLKLYKTGRTNANDGGIDFVMKPKGIFFQVSESTSVDKYLLDIDKLEHFPITFVIKSNESCDDLRSMIENGAKERYSVNLIVDKYMKCVENIINVPKLLECFNEAVQNGYLRAIIYEIILQSKVEFNIIEE